MDASNDKLGFAIPVRRRNMWTACRPFFLIPFWVVATFPNALFGQVLSPQQPVKVAFRDSSSGVSRMKVTIGTPATKGVERKEIPPLETPNRLSSNEQKGVTFRVRELSNEVIVEEGSEIKAVRDEPNAKVPEFKPEIKPESIEDSKQEAKLQSYPSYLPVTKPISQIDIGVQAKSKGASSVVPTDIARQIHGDLPVVLAQSASSMEIGSQYTLGRNGEENVHHPLYFEEPNLERYGRSTFRLQSAASAVRFYATIPALPYAMTVHRPNVAYSWKWPYEAGWAAPRVRELPPLQCKAGLVEAGTITGLAFLVP